MSRTDPSRMAAFQVIIEDHERVNDPARTALVTGASAGSGDALARLVVATRALVVGSLTFGAVSGVRVGERRAR